MNEIFKDIPNYEGVYKVSNKGRVKRILKGGREKFNKLTKLNNGYLAVHLSLNNQGKIFQIHQLIAMAFLGHTPCGHKIVVDHINNNPLDNRLDNLQLITQRENSSKDRRGGSSQYIGVSWSKAAKKWVTFIFIDNKKEYLGLFKKELDAANAHKERLNKILT